MGGVNLDSPKNLEGRVRKTRCRLNA